MSTSSRRLSQKTKPSRNNHTPGKDKGGYCVRKPDAMLACSANPYKGRGLGAAQGKYDAWWTYAKNAKGNK